MILDYQKTGIIKLVAVSTVIQAALGIAVASLLYSQISTNYFLPPDKDINHEQNDNVTTTEIPTTVEATTADATTDANITAITGELKPSPTIVYDDDGFLQFFGMVDLIAIHYTGITEVRVFLGLYLIMDSIWLITVVPFLLAIGHSRVSPLRHRYLIPWIISTVVICLLDVAGTVFFVYMLVINNELVKQLELADVKDITQILFFEFFLSKAGVFWILNVVYLVKISQGYTYWKATYEEEDISEKSYGVELAPYDGSVRKKPYDNENYRDREQDEEDGYSDHGYNNDAYEDTPDQRRYTNNPLREAHYQAEPPNKYEQINHGGDFRRFSAVDNYSSPKPKNSGAERYPESREQSRRESQMSQATSDPYRKPSKATSDPYRKPSQATSDPYRKPSQASVDPYNRRPSNREPQFDGRPGTGMLVPSNYRNEKGTIPEEDYDDYNQRRQPDPRQKPQQDRERSYYQQQKPIPKNDSWDQVNPSDRYSHPKGEGRSNPQSGLYNQRPDERPAQKSGARPRDPYDKPVSQSQRQQPESRRDDELFPIRSSLFAGAPPASNGKGRQPSFTYLPQVHADQPYNIPRINLK